MTEVIVISSIVYKKNGYKGKFMQNDSSLDLFRSLYKEREPQKLLKKFLIALTDLQHMERGSLWVKKRNQYCCIEAIGSQSEAIRGKDIKASSSSIVGWVVENGKMTTAVPGEDRRHFGEIEENLETKNTLIICLPLFLEDGKVYGAVELLSVTPQPVKHPDKASFEKIKKIIDIGTLSLSNAIVFSEQQEQTEALRKTIAAIRDQDRIVGTSKALQKVFYTVESYAAADFPVMLTGESGTGKELIAARIQQLSSRSKKTFLVQNCSAIPELLLESELFGYKKGAFTGADRDKVGLFEAADGGTVFFDEIGDMPLNLQARILRVIQNNEVKPLGSTKIIKVNVRLISATNKNLSDAVSRKEFRQDLYYRLVVLPLHLPPLRERCEDIVLLLDHFLQRESLVSGQPMKKLSADATRTLLSYDWPGNIRELENLIKFLVTIVKKKTIAASDLPLHFNHGHGILPQQHPLESSATHVSYELAGGGTPEFGNKSWQEVEVAYVYNLLEKNRWNIADAARAAKVNRSTFVSRMRRLGISKKNTPSS